MRAEFFKDRASDSTAWVVHGALADPIFERNKGLLGRSAHDAPSPHSVKRGIVMPPDADARSRRRPSRTSPTVARRAKWSPMNLPAGVGDRTRRHGTGVDPCRAPRAEGDSSNGGHGGRGPRRGASHLWRGDGPNTQCRPHARICMANPRSQGTSGRVLPAGITQLEGHLGTVLRLSVTSYIYIGEKVRRASRLGMKPFFRRFAPP